MGNCATCCGKSDTNEVHTSISLRKSGSPTREQLQLVDEIKKNGQTKEITKIQASFRGHAERKKVDQMKKDKLDEQFVSGALEINNVDYNNAKVMVSTDFSVKITNIVYCTVIATFELGNSH